MGKVLKFIKTNARDGALSAAFGMGAMAGRNFADATVIPNIKKGYKKIRNR